MNRIAAKIYDSLPNWGHNVVITLYNFKEYSNRYSKNYRKYRAQFKQNEQLTLEELKAIQLGKLKELLSYAVEKSPFYNKLYKGIDINSITTINGLEQLPIINKEDLRKNISTITTIPKSEAVIGKTGGTTGKSLEVLYTKNNTQERWAIYDNFRAKAGYEIGKKVAWFSGKKILTDHDISKKIFWKTDYWYNIRYYSTFHINDKHLRFYVENLKLYRPEFLSGFPSTMYEIAKYGLRNNIDFPKGISAIFTTAETVTSEMRDTIGQFFKAKVFNQYSSSEGAPLILECKEGRMHLELQSGVFEILNDNNLPTKEGRLIVTSFTTYGTPLIRYDIGDTIRLSDEKCSCGNNNPIAEAILGRISDYLYSSETGKINVVNFANCIKDAHGILKFQIIQDSIDEVRVLIVKDSIYYDDESEKIFLSNIRDRLGYKMIINVKYVEDIPHEASGKYSLIKNNVKQLLNEINV